MFTGRGHVSREDYYRRIYAKTASLFETATITVAMLSPAGEDVQAKVRRYGHDIGMAFQIVDDILDLTGEQTTVGKPVASDLRQGLVTLPTLYYLESHPDDPEMKFILSTPPCDEDCIERLLASIRKSGAIQQAADEARKFVECGVQALVGLPECRERRELEELAYYIVRRKF
jgi:geranylgeranyl pyrophosphate synthase